MKRTLFALGLATVLGVGFLGFTSSSAKAGTLGSVIITQGAFSNGDGGEFTATFSGGLAAALGTTSEQVFCVETDEEFSPGTTYYGSLSQDIIFDDGLFNVPSPQPSATSLAEVEYLFTQFSTGALDDFTGIAGTYFSDGLRELNAGALQIAIWTILGENLSGTSASSGADPTTAAYYETEAATAVAKGFTNQDVSILNLWTDPKGSD